MYEALAGRLLAFSFPATGASGRSEVVAPSEQRITAFPARHPGVRPLRSGRTPLILQWPRPREHRPVAASAADEPPFVAESAELI
jgi:hypothetical protein